MTTWNGTNNALIGVSLTPGDGIDVTYSGTAATVAVDIKANGGLVIDTTELTVDLGASGITGTLVVADGGTGATTLTDHGVLIGSGTSAVTPLAAAATGEILAGVTGADPAFTATPSGLTSLGATTITATTVNATTLDTNVAAAGVTLAGTTLAADGTDADIDIAITPKGTGEVDITKVDIDGGAIDATVIGGATPAAVTGTDVLATTSQGYTTGAGGAVEQITDRTTGVTLNKACGAITLVSAAGQTGWQTFTLTNSVIAATDTVVVNQQSGADLNMIHVTAVGAGSCDITFATTAGTTTEQPVFNFAVIKAVAA